MLYKQCTLKCERLLHLHENLHLNESLVDYLAFYHFGTEQGGGGGDENLDLDEFQETPSESKRDGGDKQSFQFKFSHSVAQNFKTFFKGALTTTTPSINCHHFLFCLATINSTTFAIFMNSSTFTTFTGKVMLKQEYIRVWWKIVSHHWGCWCMGIVP